VTHRGGPGLPQHHAVALRERGATAVEYVILASLIAAVIALVVGTLGLTLDGFFQGVVNGL
jgi:pilus assembly protein Flp/PilA